MILAGALPVFADIDPDTYCMDPRGGRGAVTPRTAAVVAVHPFGHPADMARLAEVGQRHGLLVMEQGASEPPSARSRRDRPHAAYLNGRS